MKYKALTCIFAAALLAPAQPASSPKPGKEVILTGCLSKDDGGIKGASANYMFTDQNSGTKMTAMGSVDLESHAANHTVKLTGKETQVGGHTAFEATKIEEVASTCQAQSGKPTGK